jgi:protein-L-isoaspartate(D-aspartate) O-methyltransferase
MIAPRRPGVFLVLALLTGILSAARRIPYRSPAGDGEDQIQREGISDPRVLQAMRDVPRHSFVPEGVRSRAYEPRPLPIGEGQTISQPYIVAFMTEILRLNPSDRVLEVGTGSGYQAAIASRISREVYTVEIFESLSARSSKTLSELGFRNVSVRRGTGITAGRRRLPSTPSS